MSETKNRRLLAILFADIVGYTRLMQNDEGIAKGQLEKFRQILNEQVDLYKGQIVHFYGDGCLAIFDNSVQACNAATAIQQQFATTPVVPVRIGLHSGPVNVDKDHVYGNAVNITSRIESLGVPGSILLSKRVRDEIRNQPDFLMVSLGQFTFKNVEEPMEVFALANEGLLVPKRAQLKGKLQPKKRRSLPILLSLMAVFLLIAGWFFWTQWNSRPLLPKEVLQSRIAVLPYNNNTNDDQLDMLGNMAADWIIQGMMNQDELKVVSYQTMKNHLGKLNGDASARPTFQKLTGAEKIIQGSFYKEGEQLIFQSQIIDVQSGAVDFAFPKVVGRISEPTQIVEEVRQRILSHFFIKGKKYDNIAYDIAYDNPPKYEAFVLWEEGEQNFGVDYAKANAAYEKAIEMDSSFFLPHGRMTTTFGNMGNWPKFDSMVQIIDRRFPNPTPWEKLYIDWFKAWRQKDLHAYYLQNRKLLEKDPKNLMAVYLSGLTAGHANRPATAVQHFASIEFSADLLKIPSDSWYPAVYADNLIKLGRLEEAQGILNIVPAEKAYSGIYYNKLRVFVLQNQRDSIQQMIRELENSSVPSSLIHGLFIEAVEWYALQKDSSNQQYWANAAIEKIRNQPESVPVDISNLRRAYLYSGQYDKALPLYADVSDPYVMGASGFCRAQLGETETAQQLIEQLKEKLAADPNQRGQYHYAIAAIYSGLGNKEKAVQYLKDAFRHGHRFGIWNYQYSYLFIPLGGYPSFEEFVQPR